MNTINPQMICPLLSNIPIQHQIKPIEQKEYLVNGQIKNHPGPYEKVLSAIYVRETESSEPAQFYLGSYPLMTQHDSLEILDAAVKAYNSGLGYWPTCSVSKRIECVKKFVFLMLQKKEFIVKSLMWEIGKSYADSVKEFDRTVEYIEDTIEALKELDRVSSRFSIEKNVIGQIRRSPLGVVLCMGPYNYPLNETFTTLIPALIMGNTIIFKPPKFGVLLHYHLLQAFKEAFPKGVVNTVYGDGPTVIGPLMKSGKIDVLAFIGSTKVADIIKHQHPKPHRLRSVLGLEAKNPAIILEDADIELAVKECLLGTLSFNGQRCTALKILFVDEDIVDEFLKRFVEELGKLRVGLPWEEMVMVTPMPDPARMDYFKQLIDEAVSQGAQIMNPNGGIITKTLLQPTVLYPANPSMKIVQDEQFGPIIPVIPFDNITVPIDFIRDSRFGQQVSIFSDDPDKIAELIDPLVNQVCRVNINSQCQRGPDKFPFVGRKDSAENTLSVSDALRVFSIRTLVAAKDSDLNKQILTNIVMNHKSNFLSTDFIL
jgi:glyceraldehyde-3-phosphate dehydrogenase (NADP+)